jgi:hypothetical protein
MEKRLFIISFKVRLEDTSVVVWKPGGGGLPENYARLIGVILEDYPYLLGS